MNKKILLILLLVPFSFCCVSIQSSIYIPIITENANCECDPCTIYDRLEQYTNPSTEKFDKNVSKLILLFMGYAWAITLLIDIIFYKLLKQKFNII